MIGPLSRSGPVLRAFTRSAALRRSVGLVGVVVALLAFTFTFSMAFTKSADQRVAWDLGKAEASARGWRSVDIGHGPTAAEARALSTRRAYGWLGLEGLFDDSAGDPVAYQEGPWADRPFPQRDTLVEGRWPTRPGEVAAATGLGVGPGDRFVLDNKLVTFRVVGVVRNASALDARTLYAAPGTWASYDPAIIQRYPSMSTSTVAYWRGGGNPQQTAAAITGDGPDDTDMMVTTREEMTSSHQSSMLLKKPLLYRGPSTLLLIGVGSLLALFSGRWVRANAPTLRAVGVPRSTVTTATVTANAAAAVVVSLAAALVGYVLGLAARPLALQATSREPPPISVPLAEILVLVLVPVLSAALVGVWTARPPTTSPRTNQYRGRLLTVARRALVVALLCAAILLVAPAGTSTNSLSILVLALALAWALLLPDVLAAGARVLAMAGPSADLAARKIRTQGGLVSSVALALCSASIIVLSLATSLSSEQAYSAAHLVTDIPRDRVILTANGAALPRQIRTDFEKASGLTDPVATTNVGMSTRDGGGSLTTVRTVTDVERLLGHRLGDRQRTVLETGGVLLQSEGPATFRVDPDGRTWKPPAAATVEMDPGWTNLMVGLTLDRNLPSHPANPSALVYAAATSADMQRAKNAPTAGGFDAQYVTTPYTPPPLQLPLWLTGASWLFAVAVGAMAWVVARRISADLATIATGLRAVGVPASYTRCVATAYISYPLITAVGWSVLGAVVAVAIPTAFVPDAHLVLSIPWLLVGSVLIACIVSVGIATNLVLYRQRRPSPPARLTRPAG